MTFFGIALVVNINDTLIGVDIRNSPGNVMLSSFIECLRQTGLNHRREATHAQ